MKARGALMGPCRLSRKTVWTVWKQAVEAIVVVRRRRMFVKVWNFICQS